MLFSLGIISSHKNIRTPLALGKYLDAHTHTPWPFGTAYGGGIAWWGGGVGVRLLHTLSVNMNGFCVLKSIIE